MSCSQWYRSGSESCVEDQIFKRQIACKCRYEGEIMARKAFPNMFAYRHKDQILSGRRGQDAKHATHADT